MVEGELEKMIRRIVNLMKLGHMPEKGQPKIVHTLRRPQEENHDRRKTLHAFC